MRVIDSPISENFLVQGAVGASIAGLIPSPEIQFDDFITLAMDGIVEHAAKMRYRSGGMFHVPDGHPLLLRRRGRRRALPLAGEPGLVHALPRARGRDPATPHDAKGLLKSAFRGQNPVLYYEHKRLYRTIKGPVPRTTTPCPWERRPWCARGSTPP